MAWKKSVASFKEEKNVSTLVYIDRNKATVTDKKSLFSGSLSAAQMRQLFAHKKAKVLGADGKTKFFLNKLPSPAEISFVWNASGLNISIKTQNTTDAAETAKFIACKDIQVNS